MREAPGTELRVGEGGEGERGGNVVERAVRAWGSAQGARGDGLRGGGGRIEGQECSEGFRVQDSIYASPPLRRHTGAVRCSTSTTSRLPSPPAAAAASLMAPEPFPEPLQVISGVTPPSIGLLVSPWRPATPSSPAAPAARRPCPAASLSSGMACGAVAVRMVAVRTWRYGIHFRLPPSSGACPVLLGACLVPPPLYLRACLVLLSPVRRVVRGLPPSLQGSCRRWTCWLEVCVVWWGWGGRSLEF